MSDLLVSGGELLIRIAPVLLLLPLVMYSMGEEAQMDYLQTPANGIISSGYDYYPAYLDDGEVVVRPQTYTDEEGNEYTGAVIEVRKPVAFATPRDTGSMQPLFGAGNTLIQEVVYEDTQLQRGDIVVYDYNGEMIIHQIVGEGDGCYLTKGMNNALPDPVCVTKDKIKYRLILAIPTK
jgi:hypothetical protein